MEKNHRPFGDKKNLVEMLSMLRNNKSLSSIAKVYNVDRSAIAYHKRRQGITSNAGWGGRPFKQLVKIEKVSPPKPKTPLPKDMKDTLLNFYVINEEKYSCGKNYEDYVIEDKLRREKEKK